jgi:hypothetical protein
MKNFGQFIDAAPGGEGGARSVAPRKEKGRSVSRAFAFFRQALFRP